MPTTELTISGMTAVHAVRAVFTALTAVEGISRADVRLGGATVVHDGRATCVALTEAVASAGYEVVKCAEERRTLPVV